MMIPRLQSFVCNVGCGPPLGLNPRLHVLRYNTADDNVFKPHFDAVTNMADAILSSLLTVLVYLNDGGGRDLMAARLLSLITTLFLRPAVTGAVPSSTRA
jgi:hypothetical protein